MNRFKFKWAETSFFFHYWNAVRLPSLSTCYCILFLAWLFSMCLTSIFNTNEFIMSMYYEIVCYWHEQYAPFSEQQEQPHGLPTQLASIRCVCVWSINVEDANKYWLLWLISSICGTIKIANILSSILQCNRLRNTRWINYYKNINSLRSFSFLLFRVTNSTVYCLRECVFVLFTFCLAAMQMPKPKHTHWIFIQWDIWIWITHVRWWRIASHIYIPHQISFVFCFLRLCVCVFLVDIIWQKNIWTVYLFI